MTEEQKLSIVKLKQDGLKYQEIADILGLQKATVAAYITRNHRDLMTIRKFTEEEMAGILELRDQGITYSVIAEQYNTNIDKIKKEVAKLLKEGKVQNIRGARGGNLSTLAKTTLYLVRFDGFYKVGITQQKIKDRFRGAPDYLLIDSLDTTLNEAWELEKLIKNSEQVLKIEPNHPWFVRNGRTECFITKKEVTSFEELL